MKDSDLKMIKIIAIIETKRIEISRVEALVNLRVSLYLLLLLLNLGRYKKNRER